VQWSACSERYNGAFCTPTDQKSGSRFPRVASSSLPRDCRQGFCRSTGGCDRNKPTVELDEGGAIEGSGPGPVAVRGLDGGLECCCSYGPVQFPTPLLFTWNGNVLPNLPQGWEHARAV